MNIKISYSKTQLEKTIEFVSKHNEFFLGKDDYIRSAVMDIVHELAANPEGTWMGTMGFVVSISERVVEDLDHDYNYVAVDFLVDPALGQHIYTDDDYHSEVITVSGIKR